MDELIEFVTEHLWLFLWIAISIFSAVGEYRKKKREAELQGDAPPWQPEGELLPPPELEFETLQQRFESQIPFESFERKLKAYEEATAKRAELIAVNQLIRERVRPELMRRWEAEGKPVTLSVSHPLKRWLEEQLNAAEAIISARVRAGGEELGLVEAIGREALESFERFARAQGVDYQRRGVLAVPTHGVSAGGLPVYLLPARSSAAYQPLELPLAIAALGEQIHDAVDGLDEDYAAGLKLQREIPLLNSLQQTSADYLRAAHGPALGAIFGDIYAVGLIGPAYGEALLYEIERRRDLSESFTYIARDWRMSGIPLALRFHLALYAIEREGRGKEAADLRARFAALTASVDGYRIFDRRGNIGKVPRQAVEAITAELASTIFAFRHPTLDGFALTRIPGLDFGGPRQRRIERAEEALGAEEIPAGSLIEAAAAAALLAGRSREKSPRFAQLLLRKYGGERPTERSRARQARAGARDERPFTEMLRDPAALRDAVALGAILTPRRPR